MPRSRASPIAFMPPDVATIPVSWWYVAVALLRAALLVFVAYMDALNGGRVRCEDRGHFVCLPQSQSVVDLTDQTSGH